MYPTPDFAYLNKSPQLINYLRVRECRIGFFTNTHTRWPHNERETLVMHEAKNECFMNDFELIVWTARACTCKKTQIESL